MAGVARLRRHPDIDPGSVGLGGFSQGGWLSPLAAASSGDVRLVIVGSAPGITPAEQNVFSAEGNLRAGGFSSEIIALASDLQRRVYDYFRSGVGRAALQADLDAARATPWFSLTWLPEVLPDAPLDMSDLDFDPLPSWEQVRVPVLAVWGELDDVVPVEISRDRILAALERAGNADVVARVFGDSGHGIRVEAGADEAWDWPRLAPGFHELMVEWAKERLE